jgi:hypothetical protein
MHLKRLTTLKVASLRTPGLHPDGGGLDLQVSASGSSSWIFRYKAGGRLRDMGLGSLSKVTLAEARELATKCRRQRLEGTDPIRRRVRSCYHLRHDDVWRA